MNWQEINDLAKNAFDNKHFDKAAELLNREDLPQELKPNLAKCLHYTKQADKALYLIKDLPKSHELEIDKALYYSATGDFDSSYNILSSLDSEKDDDRVKFNLGWHYLRLGNFQKGFQHLQYGSKCRAWGNEYEYLEKGIIHHTRRWNGKNNSRLLYILEGGLGDQIIFLRYVRHLEKSNEVVVACSDDNLIRLLMNSGYKTIHVNDIPMIKYDYYIPAMSYPAIAKLNHPNENVEFPYIQSFSEPYITKSMNRHSQIRNKKIGFKWKGNAEFEHDQMRTIDKEKLFNVLSKHNADYFCLQLDDDYNLRNAKFLIKNWQDTYSFVSNLDLVISSCTSVVHLCGAMNKPCVVMVPLLPYFVWANDDIKWYGNNIKIIRQKEYNNWDSAFQELNQYLKEFCK